jgi:F-type H+-transporting ATPase subunit b
MLAETRGISKEIKTMNALSQLTAILTGLGVNQTIWIQLILFILTYLILANLVFKPYQSALNERHKKTLGGEDVTKKLIFETQELQARFERKARQVNEEIKSVYDLARAEAARRQTEILDAARKESSDLIQKTRENISGEIKRARETLHAEIPAISSMIATRLIGKEST